MNRPDPTRPPTFLPCGENAAAILTGQVNPDGKTVEKSLVNHDHLVHSYVIGGDTLACRLRATPFAGCGGAS